MAIEQLDLDSLPLNSNGDGLTNVIMNPSFASGVLSPWGQNAATGSASVVGGKAREVCPGTNVAEGLYGDFPAGPGTYTPSVELTAISGTAQLTIVAWALSSAPAVLAISQSPVFTPAGTATRYTVPPLTAPAGTVTLRITVTTATAAARTFDLDAISSEPVYFDGDTAGYYWLGAENASASASGPFTMESLSAQPPTALAEWIKGADSNGAILARPPLHENRVIECRIRVNQQATHDAVVAHIGSVLDKLQECEQNENGLPLVWDPADSTADPITFRCLLGEITDLPIDWQDSGRFVNAWMFSIRLTCLPFGEGEEYLAGTVTSTAPIVTREVTDVPGDVPALARLVVTDTATQHRRYVALGIESRWYDASTSLIIDSTSMVTTGYAGVTATRSGAYSGASNNVISATLRTQVQAICGLPNLTHVGAFRPMLRFYASATTMAVRLTYQALDGPMRSLSYRVPVVAGWNCVDLGLISLPVATSGAQRWTGRIEAYSTETGGETFQADVILLMPAEQFGRARGAYAHTSGVLTAFEDGAGASGTLLGARTAPLGGAWTTSGAATDWTFATVTSGTFTGVDMYRQTVSDASARLGVIGSSVASTEVGADLYCAYAGASAAGSWEWGVVERQSASTDYLRATLYATTTVGGLTASAELRVTKRVGGTDTLLGSQALPAAIGEGDGTPTGTIYPIRLVTFASGRCIATVTDRAGAVLARIDVTDTALATGSALATGKAGVYDRNLSAASIFRAMDNFYSATPAAEPIVCYSGRSIEFSSDSVLREDATGTYWGRPPEYVGGRFLIPCAGAAGRKTRTAAIAKRFDVEEVGDDYTADSTTLAAYVTPRFLAVPR